MSDYQFNEEMMTGKLSEMTTIAEAVEHVLNGGILYENLKGKLCKPYYDFDPEYKTKADQKANEMSDFLKFQARARAAWPQPDAKFHWRASFGELYDEAGKPTGRFKNSFHLIVSGVGYVKQGRDIADHFPIEGMDPSVYKREGLQQKFRCLGSRKWPTDPNHRRTRMIEIVDGKIMFYKVHPTTFEDQLIQNVEGEEPIVLSAPVPLPEEKYMDTSDLNHSKLPMDMPFIKAVVDMLGAWRAVKRADWIAVVWAIKGTAMEYPQLGSEKEFEQLAQDFSKRTDEDNYDEDGCSREYARGGANKNGVMMTLGTLRMWAKLDAPEAYAALCNSYVAKKVADLTEVEFKYLMCYKKLVGKTVSMDTIKAWAQATIFPIVKGRRHYLYRHKGGDIEYKHILNVGYMQVDHGGLMDLLKKCVSVPNPEYKEGSKRPSHFKYLSQSLEYLLERDAIREWNDADFYPYHKVKPEETDKFNTFAGFEWTSYVPQREFKFEASHTYAYLRDIIARNDKYDPGLFKALLQYIAAMIQMPGMNPQQFVLLFGSAGSGKSTLMVLLSALMTEPYSVIHNKGSEMFDHFNAPSINKIFVGCEEIGEAAELHKHTEQFKSMVTSAKESATRKNIDTVKMRNCKHIVICTEHARSVRVMGGVERRMFGIEVCESKAGDRSYFGPINAELRNPDFIKAAWDWFSEYDISDYQKTAVFKTEFTKNRAGEDLALYLKHLITIFNPEQDAMNPEPEVKELWTCVRGLYEQYKVWAANEEGVTAKMSRSSYESLMSRFLGSAKDRLMQSDGNQRNGWRMSKDEIEVLFQKHLKNPAFRLCPA